MSSVLDLSIKELLDLYRKRELSCVEVMQQAVEHMQKSKVLNCFINTYEARAMEQAAQADENWKSGRQRALEGVPLGIKNSFCIKGNRITCGSRILENFIAPHTATTAEKLLSHAGGINIGDTNLDEFTLGSSNETSYYGPVINPWRSKEGEHLVPGGSSGGSAASLAARLVFGTTGTDSGGSIRQPAAFTGTVGLKPTYGLCSRFGVFAFASSVDHPGPFARSVYDCALLLEHMAGYDPNDSTSLNVEIPHYCEQLRGDVKGLVVGVPKEITESLTPELKEDMDRVMEALVKSGAKIREVSIPLLKYALPIYHVISAAEAMSNFARYDGIRYGYSAQGAKSLDELYKRTRSEGFGSEVERRILVGMFVTGQAEGKFYVKAGQIRAQLCKDVSKVFKTTDIILTPTTGSDAFPLALKDPNPVHMYLNDYFTVLANMTGAPAVSVPIGLNAKSGLPRSVQLMGNHLQESKMLDVAYFIEQEFGTTPLVEWWWRE